MDWTREVELPGDTRRTLNLGPLNGRTPFADLDVGLPARVVLEPGDATRYEFLLVPLVGELEGAGGYSVAPVHVAHVPVNLASTGTFCAIPLIPSYPLGPYDFECYATEYTRYVVAAFHNALGEALRERHAEPVR